MPNHSKNSSQMYTILFTQNIWSKCIEESWLTVCLWGMMGKYIQCLQMLKPWWSLHSINNNEKNIKGIIENKTSQKHKENLHDYDYGPKYDRTQIFTHLILLDLRRQEVKIWTEFPWECLISEWPLSLRPTLGTCSVGYRLSRSSF